ncbi:hypothetical protein [Cryobacterium sp. GrIS_2_6]|uniref:hypothetical protein n=1 Tax=Cryobacterium sp. GrIS_2_6 TaxID=3162785 RepID=UPI002E030B28|nr:hypothetical protein [Cryobacterium psychrotolerans]
MEMFSGRPAGVAHGRYSVRGAEDGQEHQQQGENAEAGGDGGTRHATEAEGESE